MINTILESLGLGRSSNIVASAVHVRQYVQRAVVQTCIMDTSGIKKDPGNSNRGMPLILEIDVCTDR